MPRIDTPTAARPVYYDRSAIEVHDDFLDQVVAPHAFVARDTYTVPSGKKTFVETGVVKLNRDTAASTPGFARITLAILPSGGSLYSLFQAIVWGNFNSIGDRDDEAGGFTATLFEGDALETSSSDGSTDGTFDYFGAWKGVEFDA